MHKIYGYIFHIRALLCSVGKPRTNSLSLYSYFSSIWVTSKISLGAVSERVWGVFVDEYTSQPNFGRADTCKYSCSPHTVLHRDELIKASSQYLLPHKSGTAAPFLISFIALIWKHIPLFCIHIYCITSYYNNLETHSIVIFCFISYVLVPISKLFPLSLFVLWL